MLHLVLLFTPLAPDLCTGRHAQEPSSPIPIEQTIELPVLWDVGLRSSIEIVKRREEWKNGGLVQSRVSTMPIEVECLAEDEQGYVCRWRYGKTMLSATNEFAERIAAMMDGFAVDMRLDESGSVVGFADEEQARRQFEEHVTRFRRTLLDQVGEGTKEAELLSSALNVTRSTLEGPAFASSMLKEPSLFYMWCGGSYELGSEVAYDDLLPNPFGGEPLPAKARLKLTELRPDAAEASIEWSQTLDARKATEMVLAFARTTAEKLGKPVPRPEEVPRLDVQDQASFIFDLSTGTPKSARWSRTITTGDSKRVDALVFTTRSPSTK